MRVNGYDNEWRTNGIFDNKWLLKNQHGASYYMCCFNRSIVCHPVDELTPKIYSSSLHLIKEKQPSLTRNILRTH